VDRGCLPIFSLKSNRWFGITASLTYKGYRCPKDVPHEYRNRRRLTDLLESRKHMNIGKGGTRLCYGHHSGPFLILLLDNLSIDDDLRHRYLHINNVYPRTQEKWRWLTGGDLLCASAILFSLVDVQYMTVGEGPDVRYFENRKRGTHPEYFYYNKILLVPAQSAVSTYGMRSELFGYDSEDDEDVHMRLVRTPNRDPNSVIGWWFWDKGVRNEARHQLT